MRVPSAVLSLALIPAIVVPALAGQPVRTASFADLPLFVQGETKIEISPFDLVFLQDRYAAMHDVGPTQAKATAIQTAEVE